MRVVLHVGLRKTGTTYLQALLAGHRDRLRAGGVIYPFIRPGAMFQGAAEVRGSAARFGLDPVTVAGTWAAVCARAREFAQETGGTGVISHEVLAGATPDQVAWALGPLAGVEVDVVVTARDLGRQAVAHWQEEVKLGDTRSFAEFESSELLGDSGRDLGPDAGGVRPHFWHAQDFADVLRRWTALLPAGRGHLVVCPAPGARRDELWNRFADACGIDRGLVDPAVPVPANPSLGGPEIALLRAVNRELGTRLPPEARLRVVKREYAEGELAARAATPPRTPARLGPDLELVTRSWLTEVADAGYAVHGDPADLRPVLAGPGDPPPDVPPPPGSDAAAVAAGLVARGG